MPSATVVLSYGAGQDSHAILHRLLHDQQAWDEYVGEAHLLVICADTGDEHPETYETIRETQALVAADPRITFVHLTPSMGYHSAAWPSLRGFYRSHNACGSAGFPKTCTEQLKIRPIYKFLEAFLGQRYGYPSGRKKALRAYSQAFGKISMLIGIARGEETRVPTGSSGHKWMDETVQKRYPLLEWGWDRAACQGYLRSIQEKVPVPSNCMLCPFQSPQEILLLAREHPADFRDWQNLEAAKIWANLGKVEQKKNLGVYGRITLAKKLEKAEAQYGHLSLEDLRAHRMSHGHCVSQKY